MNIDVKRITSGHYLVLDMKTGVLLGSIDKVPGGAWALIDKGIGHIPGQGYEFTRYAWTRDLAVRFYGDRRFCVECGLMIRINPNNPHNEYCAACAAELKASVA